MSLNVKFNDFYLNRDFIVSPLTKEGNPIYKISNRSGQHLKVECCICKAQRWLGAQVVENSILNSWHKSYRCLKCINIGRVYSDSHRKSIGKGNSGKPFTEQRIKNIIASISNMKKTPKKFIYKDYIFRSSYEVRCAKILDFLHIKFYYEKKTLKVFDGVRPLYYLPDFYLPEFDIFIEVKGWWRDDDRKYKFQTIRSFGKDKFCLAMDKDLKEVEHVLWG
jgi:predicted nuclease of restriction endonuclease-like RecB superfamily